MLKVGITGGIGSGKSIVCQVWQDMGADVMNADQEAKLLMETDPLLVNQIKEKFGQEAYTAQGKLNRDYLSREAFQNNRVEELNQLVHPAVFRETDRRIEYARDRGYKLFVKEAALLLNYGKPEQLDYIVVVVAPEHLRIKRVVQRDNISSEQVKNRISRQMPQDEMIKFADYVLENDQDEKTLITKAKALFNELVQKVESNN